MSDRTLGAEPEGRTIRVPDGVRDVQVTFFAETLEVYERLRDGADELAWFDTRTGERRRTCQIAVEGASYATVHAPREARS